MKIKVHKIHPDAVLPVYATHGSSGFDLVAIEDVTLKSGETKLIRTGLAFNVGYEYELQIRPRSGISLNTKLRVANSPGTVDSDYRGEVHVIMTNTDTSWRLPWRKGILIKKGDRVAQGVVCPIARAIIVVEPLDTTDRVNGGFGSTGK